MRFAVIGLLILGISYFSACDKVDDPYQHLTEIDTAGTGDIDSSLLFFSSSDTSVLVRKVLVEEYTGIKCGNCPDMARVLKDILDTSDQVILVAIQADCSQLSHPDDKHPIDLRGPESSVYCNEISNGDVIPYSLVNFKADAGKVSTGEVAEGISDLLKDNAWLTPRLDLDITTSYYPQNRVLSIDNKVQVLNGGYSGKIGVISYLVENGIIAPQTDYRYRDDPDRLNKTYKHDHTLRKAIPSAWGTELGENLANAEVVSEFSQYQIPDEFVAENCEVVSLVYDIDTREVLQVDVVKNIAN